MAVPARPARQSASRCIEGPAGRRLAPHCGQASASDLELVAATKHASDLLIADSSRLFPIAVWFPSDPRCVEQEGPLPQRCLDGLGTGAGGILGRVRHRIANGWLRIRRWLAGAAGLG